jgi:hypothetical protein
MTYLGFDQDYLDKLTVFITTKGARKLRMCFGVVQALQRKPESADRMPYRFRSQCPAAWVIDHNRMSAAVKTKLSITEERTRYVLTEMEPQAKNRHIARWVKAAALRKAGYKPRKPNA